WLLGFVYAAASLSAGPPDTAGLEAAEASRLVLEATHERLTRAHMAAGIAQWTAIATVLATVGVTAWAWSRPAAAPGAEEAG
ncbi:MAG: hypothetical protein KC656_19690, partial [Myxococcales bacterium]|nr:hypothetical protein [Myxococcales bacterium]